MTQRLNILKRLGVIILNNLNIGVAVAVIIGGSLGGCGRYVMSGKVGLHRLLEVDRQTIFGRLVMLNRYLILTKIV